MNSIEIKNITKHYDEFTLNNVSLTVEQGTVMGFVGENGAGKTTVIKAILGLISTDDGTIEVLGKPNGDANCKIKERIGVVMDGSSFPPMFKLTQVNNTMRGIYTNWDEKKFFALAQQFGLSKNKKLKEYSKGMVMKLSIAVALAHNPELLILDEPTSGLDPIVRSEILDIFLDFMQDETHSILFSTHITSDLEHIADYITFIHNGSVIFTESKETLSDCYGVIKCGKEDADKLDESDIVGKRISNFGCETLVKNKASAAEKYRFAACDDASIEDIMLYYVRSDK